MGVSLNKISTQEFKQWFVGLVDGEGNFDISPINLKKGYFTFRIRIKLHIDDLPLLNYIKRELNCGNIELNQNNACLVFLRHDELKSIIFPLFDGFPLNSQKHLNFVEFKNAFNLYVSFVVGTRKTMGKGEEISNKILLFKNKMNFKRLNFEMPTDHNINITPYWLLGYIEGESSFFCVSPLLRVLR